MKIPFTEGEFVSSSDGELNYEDVLKDFPNAHKVRILTYNISRYSNDGTNLGLLKNLPDTTDVQIITNMPSRFPIYYGNAQERFRQNMDVYLSNLNPENYKTTLDISFDFRNHAKIIGTENIVYIGSANYSDESKYNLETGVIIRDKAFIERLYKEFFHEIKEQAVPYFQDDFNALRLFAVSMETKFNIYYMKYRDELLYQDRLKNWHLSEEPRMDKDGLEDLSYDLDSLGDIRTLLENCYEEGIEDEELDGLIADYDGLDINWMEAFVMTDSDFYEYTVFDLDERTNQILQDEYYAEAYDEYLDHYIDIASDDARELMRGMVEDLELDAVAFWEKLEKIVEYLGRVHSYLVSNADSKINKKIDNS